MAKLQEDDRRAALLAAAREEFVHHGLDRATMRGIARRAGRTTGAIYPVFASKQALCDALVAESLRRLDAHVAAAIAGSKSPRRQVRLGCQAVVSYYLAHDFEASLALLPVSGSKRRGAGKAGGPDLDRAWVGVLERIVAPLAAAMDTSTASARSLAALLFSQMIGSVVLQHAGRLEALRADAPTLLDVMLQGLLPHPPSRKMPT